MLGVPLEAVEVRLADSDFPISAGSGGSWGANSSTAGLYAACEQLRAPDRKGVVEGKGVSVRVDLGGRRLIQRKEMHQKMNSYNNVMRAIVLTRTTYKYAH